MRLALSLHAPEDALRSQLMPVNDRYPLADVLAACRGVLERKRRRVFVEYVMLAGVNDRYEQASRSPQLLDPREAFKVNLIPYNPTDSPYDGSSRDAIAAFRAALEARGMRGDGPADPRPRHRRRLRAAGGSGLTASGPAARRDRRTTGL